MLNAADDQSEEIHEIVGAIARQRVGIAAREQLLG